MMPGVDPAPGVIVLVSASALMVLAAFVLRTRVPAAVGVFLLAAAGGAFGWGILHLQPNPSVGESIAAVGLLAVLTPAHVRIVFGRYGPAAREASIRALAAPGERR
jgi:hypothetical protein